MYGGTNVLSRDTAHGISNVTVKNVLMMKLNGMNIIQEEPNQRKKEETLRESFEQGMKKAIHLSVP